MNNGEKEDSLTLSILTAIEKKDDVTQRHLANDLGVALGLANSYLKRCAKKGLIKIKQAPANRYLYYLTPKGFSEKSRLSAKYLSVSFDFYRKASNSFRSLYRECMAANASRILLCGFSEFTEIAFIRAQEFDVELVGIWDPNLRVSKKLGLPVWTEIEQVPMHDACFITGLGDTAEMIRTIEYLDNTGRLFVPDIPGLSVSQPGVY